MIPQASNLSELVRVCAQVGASVYPEPNGDVRLQMSRFVSFKTGCEIVQVIAADMKARAVMPPAPTTPLAPVTFAKLLPVLMRACDVPPASTTRFIARLRKYGRLGFPEGLESRRGKSTNYTFEQAFDMVLAISSGFTSERAVELVCSKREQLRRAGQNGTDFVFRPISSLANLTNNPLRKANTVLIWPAGALWKTLVDSGLWDISTQIRACRPRERVGV